jgi:hypothetical protein
MEAKLFSYRTDGNAGKPLDPWNSLAGLIRLDP